MVEAERIYEGAPRQAKFFVPHDVIKYEFCPLSGGATGPYCTHPMYGHNMAEGWFVAGSEPQTICDFHTEPPISVIPYDPEDPNRIPPFESDILKEYRTDPPRGEGGGHPLSRWLRFFARGSR